MRIVNGKKLYKQDIDACVSLHFDGWDSYNGRNHQWYNVKYNPECGLVILDADNSGDCYGDYETRYFSSPAKFREWCQDHDRSLPRLMGDIDEDNEAQMAFVAAAYPD